jgi:Zn-dependent M28 family amino/carboxypeptidase
MALLGTPPTYAAGQPTHQALESITEAELRDHIFFLASDRLQGRDTGSDGYQLAADYAAIHLDQAGLEAMYVDSTGSPSYFQQIQFGTSTLNSETSLSFAIGGRERDLVRGEDFVIQEFLASGADRSTTEAPVFLGYGIEEPTLGWNDYEDLDAEGRIGVMVVGAPLRNGEPILPQEQHQLYSSLQRSANARFQAAMNHGVTTLVVVLDSASTSLWELIRSQANTPSVKPLVQESETGAPGPAFSELVLLRPESATELLADVGFNPLTETGEYVTGIMEEVQVSLHTRHTVEPAYSSPNVVGLLPGTDPVLKDEYVVVTAHLDHVGIQDGAIFNGADDNASGSAAVLEAAEAAGMAPGKRSLIFVLLTAEEKGLLGSQAFAATPPIPMEQIVLNINLDMVGRNSPDFPHVLLAMASETGRSALLQMIREVNESGVGAPLDWRLNEGPDPHAHVQRSDQMSFMQKGVPAILITRGFMGPDYHEPSDDPETINYEKVVHAARLTFALAMEVADREDVTFGARR